MMVSLTRENKGYRLPVDEITFLCSRKTPYSTKQPVFIGHYGTCIGKIKFLRNQVKEKVGNLETKINFGDEARRRKIADQLSIFRKITEKRAQ